MSVSFESSSVSAAADSAPSGMNASSIGIGGTSLAGGHGRPGSELHCTTERTEPWFLLSTQLPLRAMHPDRMRYSAENCSIRRTLDIVGEKWTLLVLREAFYGVRRFADIHRAL